MANGSSFLLLLTHFKCDIVNNMYAEIMSVVTYLIIAAVVVFASIKLSDYVDLLDKKTNLSGALLGGVLLAAVTSLPELFTSISSTLFIHKNSFVVGNILGSNLFNMCLFFIPYVFFFAKLAKAKVGKSHLLSLTFMGLLYITVNIAGFVFNFYNILWGWFNPLSIVIVAIYAISIWKTPKEEESEDKETESKLTVKQIAVLFAIFSVLLIAMSIGITYHTNWIVNTFKFGDTFGGALFLGVATSLPELTATINLCKKRNFNAAYGNILGSCVFNFFILAFADVLSFNCGPLYRIDQSSFLLLIGGIVSMFALSITIILLVRNKVKPIPGFRILFISTAFLVVGLYIAFLVLSNIDMHLSFAPFVLE